MKAWGWLVLSFAILGLLAWLMRDVWYVTGAGIWVSDRWAPSGAVAECDFQGNCLRF
jgi:hypothetical protein